MYLLGRLVKEGATFWRIQTTNVRYDVSMPSEQLMFKLYVFTEVQDRPGSLLENISKTGTEKNIAISVSINVSFFIHIAMNYSGKYFHSLPPPKVTIWLFKLETCWLMWQFTNNTSRQIGFQYENVCCVFYGACECISVVVGRGESVKGSFQEGVFMQVGAKRQAIYFWCLYGNKQSPCNFLGNPIIQYHFKSFHRLPL